MEEPTKNLAVPQISATARCSCLTPAAPGLRLRRGRPDLRNTRHADESRVEFAKPADLTRDRDDAPLRIAHCLRDLAYCDESRDDVLKTVVASDQSAYREIFGRCYWRPTEGEP